MHIHMYTKYVENNVFAPKVSKETSYYLCYIPKMLNKVFGIQFENALRHHFWCDVVCKCTCVCEDWGAHQSWRTRNAHLWFCENWDSSYTFAFSMDWNIYAQKNKQTTYCVLQELPKWVSNMENIAGLQLNYDSQAKHTTISWMIWRKWNKWKSSINEVSVVREFFIFTMMHTYSSTIAAVKCLWKYQNLTILHCKIFVSTALDILRWK